MSHHSAHHRSASSRLPLVAVLAVCAASTLGPLVLLGGVRPPGWIDRGRLEKIWGSRGLSDGKLFKPRTIAIDREDRVFIADKTGRILVFDTEGRMLRSWTTPQFDNGMASGLSIDNDGNLLVADTHYYRMLVYTPEGRMLEERTIGGTLGHEPGQFGFVTDAVQDSQGNYYISEYGEYDRIQKFSPEGRFLFQWGGHGDQRGQFIRPQNLCVDREDHVWVADACNHRIQVFDATGQEARLVRTWGTPGEEPGQLRYPYDLLLDGKGHLYVCEFGNHRVQKFTLDGRLRGYWGNEGRRQGELHNPWGMARDSRGRIHVLDTYNHRVQRIRL